MVAAVVLAAAQVVEGTDYYATTNSDNGLGMLDDMLQTDPSQVSDWRALQRLFGASCVSTHSMEDKPDDVTKINIRTVINKYILF